MDRCGLEAILGDSDTRKEPFPVGPDWGTGLGMAHFLPTSALAGRCAQHHYPCRKGSEGVEDLLKVTVTVAELKHP